MKDSERRENELEFVKAAYEPTEAWCTQEEGTPTVHRLLKAGPLAWLLRISLSDGYPGGEEILKINVIVDEEHNATNRKSAFQRVSELRNVCVQVAESLPGEEALYAVLNAAEEWAQENENVTENKMRNDEEVLTQDKIEERAQILGRRLIYSHHIISKRKRSDILELARHLYLTGFMKIGWPGIIIIEGSEEDCQSFYDGIRGWSWQYLVVRGEMQQSCMNLEKSRRFPVFTEVEDMSIVASHCREVGLEALFRTSMKVYADDDNKVGTSVPSDSSEKPYGALVLVDHMNDGKSYRKWLRKACYESDVLLFLQQCYPNDDYLRRPKIIVGLVGGDVGAVLKQWRTRKVDVDSKGKACLERMMTILVEGVLEQAPRDGIQWEEIGQDDKRLNATTEQVKELVHAIGGKQWTDALEQLWVC